MREYIYDYASDSGPAPPPLNTNVYNGIFYREAETYDFDSGWGTYHREYIPFLKLYYKVDWEDTNPRTTTGQGNFYALDGRDLNKSTQWNDDLRIADMNVSQATWAGARDAITADSIQYGDQTQLTARARYDSGPGPYDVDRVFLAFDTAEITDDIEDITLVQIRVRSYGYGSSGATPRAQVFQGTWDYTLTTSDFDSYIDVSLIDGAVTWNLTDNYLYFTLNQTGIDYVKNNIGKIV